MAILLLAVATLPARLRAAARHALGALRGGDGRARDRHLALDGSDRRRARRGSPPRRPRPGASSPSCPRSTASPSSPSARARSSWRRRRRTASSSTRRSAALRVGQGTALGDAIATSVKVAVAPPPGEKRPAGEAPPPAAVLVLSDGAQDGGRVRLADAIARARKAKVPVFTALLGTAAGVVQVPHVGGYVERIQVPPNPAALRAVAAQTGGSFFAAPTQDDLKPGLRRPQVAPRQDAQGRGDHRRLRRRPARSSCSSAARSRPSGSGGCRDPGRGDGRSRWPRPRSR